MDSVKIEGHEFSLLRDRDQGSYGRLSFQGKVTYLDRRVDGILISPCQNEMKRAIEMDTGLILVTAICAGISAAGTFLHGCRGRGKDQAFFVGFVRGYMKPLLTNSGPEGWANWAEWLYKDIRSGLAHSFTIEKGGMKLEPVPYVRIANHGPEIHAPTLLNDFADGWKRYLNDVRNGGQTGPLGKKFNDRFDAVFHD